MSKYISIEYDEPYLKQKFKDKCARKIQEYRKGSYYFQKRTLLVDVENKDFIFLDEVNSDYEFLFPQIEVFYQINGKSLTLTFKDNEQYQKAKSQIIQAIT